MRKRTDRRPVVGTSVDGKVTVRYESMTAAANDGFDLAAVSRCCAGKLNTHREFYWKLATTPAAANPESEE